MNKRQIEVQKNYAAEEEKVIKNLKLVYGKAQCDCVNKIIDLSKRRDMENLQSIIWQKQYQEALNKQLESVLNALESESFVTVADYLTGCYEDGFFGTLYDLQGQGIPLMFPMNQEQVVQAVQIDSKISQGLYRRMGEDIDWLKKSIRIELARGIANGSSWNEVAEKIARGMNSPFDRAYNRAIGIARTEGHRVQQESTLHCQQRAIEKGADMVKQWDSTLDNLTRPHHRELDGQVREIDEPFEVAGKKAMYPGGFGDPSEDCNCRCCLLSRARSALSEEKYYTKWDGDKDELVRVSAGTYNEFKQAAQALNNSLNHQIVNYTHGDYAVKERVVYLEAITYMPQKVKDYLENTTICVGSKGSAYDPVSGTIYIGTNASRGEVIHEIGHAIESSFFDRDKVNFVKSLCVKGLSVEDIITTTARDSSGYESEIYILQSDKFLNHYQGKLYVANPFEAVLDDGTINTDYLKEFVSVAVEQYFENAERVKKKNYDIFALVEEALK